MIESCWPFPEFERYKYKYKSRKPQVTNPFSWHNYHVDEDCAKMMIIVQKLRSFFLYSLLVVVFCLGTILRVFPFFKRFISNAIDRMFGLKIPQDDYWDSMFSRQMLRGLWRFILLDINKKTKLGAKAYNSPLFSVDGKDCFRLFEKSKLGRPLVVNFGSSSWQPFLTKLRDFGEIVRDFADIADFVIVYIEEAHPSDGWALKNNYNIPKHRTQAERCAAAQLLLSHNPPCTVTVDTMLDAANLAYGASPERFYIIRDSKIVYQGGPGPMSYNVNEVRAWLENYAGKLSSKGRGEWCSYQTNVVKCGVYILNSQSWLV